jgi:hypothetical protein
MSFIGFNVVNFDGILLTIFSHVYGVPILMIAMTYTQNVALLILQILCLLTGTWMFVDNVNVIKGHSLYSREYDLSIHILIGIVMVSEVITMAMFGSIMNIMMVVVANMLLIILNAMIDFRKESMIQFWYELSSLKSFTVSMLSLYLVIQNPNGNTVEV